MTGFLPGILSGVGKIYCYANFFCYANFSVVFGQNFGRGRGGQTEASMTLLKTAKSSKINTNEVYLEGSNLL